MSRIFSRSNQLAQKVYDVKLYIPEWKVLFAMDGKMDAEELASFLELENEDVNEAITRLQELELAEPLEEEEFAADIAGAPVQEETEEEKLEEFEPEAEEPTAEEEFREESLEELREEPPETEREKEGEKEEEKEPEAEIETEPEKSEIEFDLESMDEESRDEDAGEELEQLSLEEESEDQESGEEDLDQLIDDLLKDEGTPEEEVPEDYQEEAAPEEEQAMPSESDFNIEAETEEEESKDEFDFGDIFQKEMTETEQSLDEMLDTMEKDAETEEFGGEEAEAAPSEAEGKRKNILVVDDSVVIRKMVEIALENENYEIVSVANGKAALSFLDENEPDLVILDIMLPDVNGLDILKAIKANKKIPVVMLSAKDTPRETSKAKELGADNFIPKPFKDEELIETLHELIGA